MSAPFPAARRYTLWTEHVAPPTLTRDHTDTMTPQEAALAQAAYVPTIRLTDKLFSVVAIYNRITDLGSGPAARRYAWQADDTLSAMDREGDAPGNLIDTVCNLVHLMHSAAGATYPGAMADLLDAIEDVDYIVELARRTR